jgi:gas vesicle protein
MIGRKNSAKKTLKRAAIGGALAATAGYVAGLLTAPKSGRETRDDLKHAADRGMSEAEKDLKRLHTELSKAIDDTKDSGDKLGKKAQSEFEQLLGKAKDTKEKAREVLSAIHEGDADDKDLKKAIKDANAAIDHIRDYLKK